MKSLQNSIKTVTFAVGKQYDARLELKSTFSTFHFCLLQHFLYICINRNNQYIIILCQRKVLNTLQAFVRSLQLKNV